MSAKGVNAHDVKSILVWVTPNKKMLKKITRAHTNTLNKRKHIYAYTHMSTHVRASARARARAKLVAIDPKAESPARYTFSSSSWQYEHPLC